MKKYLIILFIFCFLLVPRETYAEDFYSGDYLVYYQNSDLTTTHLNSYAVYYKNFYSYNVNTTSFQDTWYYTTQLDTTSIQGGSIYIPYIVSHQVLTAGTTTYYSQNLACSYWNCTTDNDSTYCVCNSYNNSTATDYEFYDSEVSMIVRCYYDGSTTFVPGRIEGNNIICPVKSTANYLYGIRIFHRVIGATSFEYSLGLASGITLYSSSTSAIVEAEEDTTSAVESNTDAINDLTSSINSTSTSGSGVDTIEDSVTELIPTDETTSSWYSELTTWWNSLETAINSTSCSPYSMELLENTITFPCIDVENIIGSELWSIIDFLMSFFCIIEIYKLIIGWFESITDFEDLSYMSEAKHIKWSREDYRKGMYG